MKINEFIEAMNQSKIKILKTEQKQEYIKNILEVKSYLSIKDKKQLVRDIVNECILYEDGMFKFDDIDKYVCFTMKTIAAYMNLELSDDIEDDYDILCESMLLDCIIDTFKKEYDEVNILLQMRCEYILSGNNIEAQIGKFLTDILSKLDMLGDVLVDKIGNFNLDQLPINKEDLGKVLEFVNKYQK